MYKHRDTCQCFMKQILSTYIVQLLDRCSKILQTARCIHPDCFPTGYTSSTRRTMRDPCCTPNRVSCCSVSPGNSAKRSSTRRDRTFLNAMTLEDGCFGGSRVTTATQTTLVSCRLSLSVVWRVGWLN